MPLGKIQDPDKPGFKGSPADRLLRAFNQRILQPAGRELREFVRGDAMSGDIGISDIGGTRPARFVRRLGQGAAEGFENLEAFANRNVPRVERKIRRFIDQF